MAEFLGARISLISKSDIRYAGTLHEINSEESTVALENVRSFGTEGRRGKPDEEIGASDQVYEYIVFRGSDVKDLRIEQGPAPKEEQPPAMPNDPAILGARPRPAQGQAPHHFMPGPPGPFGPNMHMPPPPPNWGPPGPGSPHPGFPHQPPPGWMPPHGFPPGPFGPGGPGGPGPVPWGNQFYPPGVPTPPGAPGGPGFQHQNRQQPPQTPENRPAPIGAAADKQRQMPPIELADEPKSFGQAGPSHAQAQPRAAKPPAPPIESKPTVEEVKATAAALAMNAPGPSAAKAQAPIPTGPRVTKIMPAIPLPTALTNKAGQPAKQANAQSAAVSQAAIKDATDAARAAVTAAMAKLDPYAAGPLQVQHPNGGNAMDNLTRKVNEMRVNAARTDTHSSRGGRGRGGGSRPAKVEVPKDDFDFATANAKFNKEDIVKEAIAGSPLGDAPDASHDETPEASDAVPPPAYSKTRSFFDNISSEAKERAENGGQKPGGREWRGVEQRKNMETFGQGSVDGGSYRGYRGRGRGRGRGGRGRGGRGGYRNDGQSTAPIQ